MIDVAKFPYLTARKGSSNLYYKREVPPELRADGRPSQIWRSLRTGDQKTAQAAYGAQHAEVEALFAQWRKEESQPGAGRASPKSASEAPPTTLPLTPALLRRLAEAHYLNVYEIDFQWRGGLWKKVHEDEDAFWRGDIVKLAEDDWVEFRGKPHSYFAHLMEEPALEDVFLYSIFRARKAKLQRLQKRYRLGDSCELAPIADAILHSKAIALGDADRSRLMRKLMEVEIKALEDLTAGSEASFDCIVDRQSAVEDPPAAAMAPAAGQLMSQLVDKYLEDTAREREWPSKTVLRKRGELREFLEIAGDKPINAYRKVDGVAFKDVQLSLPIYRQKSPFKGLTLVAASCAPAVTMSTCSIQSPSTTRLERSHCSSNGQSRATAASPTRWRINASSVPRTSARARSGIRGPLRNSTDWSLLRFLPVAILRLTGRSKGTSYFANRRCTGFRS